jgi:predicted transposase/invertase (TIGR01784 family)
MRSFQVTFANFPVLPGDDEFMSRFSFRDDGGYELDDAVGIILIELSKLDMLTERPVEEMTGAEQWALFFAGASKPDFKPILDKIITAREAIRVATSILTGISKDDEERARFRSRRMYQMDRTTELNAARREGLAEGRKDGAVEIARKLLKRGLPLNDIAEDTGLTAEQIKRLRDG